MTDKRCLAFTLLAYALAAAGLLYTDYYHRTRRDAEIAVQLRSVVNASATYGWKCRDAGYDMTACALDIIK